MRRIVYICTFLAYLPFMGAQEPFFDAVGNLIFTPAHQPTIYQITVDTKKLSHLHNPDNIMCRITAIIHENQKQKKKVIFEKPLSKAFSSNGSGNYEMVLSGKKQDNALKIHYVLSFYSHDTSAVRDSHIFTTIESIKNNTDIPASIPIFTLSAVTDHPSSFTAIIKKVTAVGAALAGAYFIHRYFSHMQHSGSATEKTVTHVSHPSPIIAIVDADQSQEQQKSDTPIVTPPLQPKNESHVAPKTLHSPSPDGITITTDCLSERYPVDSFLCDKNAHAQLSSYDQTIINSIPCIRRGYQDWYLHMDNIGKKNLPESSFDQFIENIKKEHQKHTDLNNAQCYYFFALLGIGHHDYYNYNHQRTEFGQSSLQAAIHQLTQWNRNNDCIQQKLSKERAFCKARDCLEKAAGITHSFEPPVKFRSDADKKLWKATMKGDTCSVLYLLNFPKNEPYSLDLLTALYHERKKLYEATQSDTIKQDSIITCLFLAKEKSVMRTGAIIEALTNPDPDHRFIPTEVAQRIAYHMITEELRDDLYWGEILPKHHYFTQLLEHVRKKCRFQWFTQSPA